jgi:phosphomannomutase
METNNLYLFDIDGTLTAPRCTIEPEFAKWFKQASEGRRIVLITGSDKDKTIEQLGYLLWKSYPSYQCAGNQLWFNDILLYENKWQPPQDLLDFLNYALDKSSFNLRCGRHIELRPGMVNFSIVGRDCSMEQRKIYNLWDIEKKERMFLVDKINEHWPELESSAGGQISIDIYPKGCGKGQVVQSLLKSSNVIFFGDRTMNGGNDYEIAKQLPLTNVIQVDGPQTTFRNLNEIWVN